MSYQVLARKWRPATFSDMVGQSHVLKALINALDQQRLHHAYLFTGTRGVGKTTLARLLAKSLNCEQGVSSRPCGVCSACREIAEGRFVDLLEIDAASRTRVEDTRELLDNVQYAPTRGRYKIYLIDEVHMLSTHSFNALLKTLEEPPPHVKFLLATTDPQKLPVTVLSRCLQFNLKSMTREGIVGYLQHILAEETVPFDDPSLWLLAEAAAGSMRDALSLTDQAIAFGEGQLRETEVAAMLGTVDLKRVLNLVRGLIEKDASALMAQVAELAEHAPDFRALMNELLSTLHRVAIAQAAPDALDNSKGDRNVLVALAQAAQPEDVHLFYQFGTASVKDLALAPSERAGFEMALLRMLAFSPSPARSVSDLPPLASQSAPALPTTSEPTPPADSAPHQAAVEQTEPATTEVVPSPSQTEVVEFESHNAEPPVNEEPMNASLPEPDPAPEPVAASIPPWEDEAAQDDAIAEAEVLEAEAAVDQALAHWVAATVVAEELTDVAALAPPMAAEDGFESVAPALVDGPALIEEPAAGNVSASVAGIEADAVNGTDEDINPARWPEVDFDADPQGWWQVTLYKLGLSGMTRTLFAHSQWQAYADGRAQLLIATNYRKLMNDTHSQRLREALATVLPGFQGFDYEFGAAEKTPQAWLDQLNRAAWERAVNDLQEDRFVQSLVSDFAAELRTDTVQPRFNPLPTGA
ncbi:DNA polymerase III subunit gamma/tau [Saccharospirillum mangrovi]|uniref:DNA polymerase III subunit gamma/tau n=1 Tax=Saccharospirillum mangrovi TaxID=2161747 RepID=UPI000D3BA087|nr:DNA polymerase III subunit gamma/tau [Saccharospirillum mangrovi]